MMKKPVDFTYIRYANCWEDADLLMQNVRVQSGDRVLSIASGGDNTLALLAGAPSVVWAFDINPAQLYLTELKQIAIKHLPYKDVLNFLGFEPCEDRTGIFKILSPHLSKECNSYFINNFSLVTQGIIHQGKFENYFRIFRKYILPLVHPKATIDKLFQIKSKTDQELFYMQKWNTIRWKLLFRFFFSKFVLGRFGRDPAFFNEVQQPVAKAIFSRAAIHLKEGPVGKNHFLDYQLRGKYSVALPMYLRPEYFETIKQNIDRLQFFHGSLTDIPREEKFDILNLSNIFEYMNAAAFTVQAGQIAACCHPNARIAYWNLLVDRKLSDLDPRFTQLQPAGEDLCFFYQSFNLNTCR